jgi:hypothetical protein
MAQPCVERSGAAAVPPSKDRVGTHRSGTHHQWDIISKDCLIHRGRNRQGVGKSKTKRQGTHRSGMDRHGSSSSMAEWKRWPESFLKDGILEQQLAGWNEELLGDGIFPWQLTECGECTESF